MYLQIPPNGYHSPSPIIAQPATLIGALVDTYRKRAMRNIDVKEYRKVI